MFGSHALIISKRVIAANQLATLLKTNGFIPKVELNCTGISHSNSTESLVLLITDIDDPKIQAISTANRFRNSMPGLAWFALSRAGNKQAMRDARSFMVGGFFFLTDSGLELDRQRGSARFLSDTGCTIFENPARNFSVRSFNSFGTPSGFLPA